MHPPPTSLLSLTAANVGYFEADSGGGVKIGAGHKPQPYDDHGRYTGPGGGPTGQTGQRSSTVLSVLSQDGQEGGQDEETAMEGQPEELAVGLVEALEALETQEANPSLDGVLIADSGQIRSDAGGLSGGPEVRGPVTGPEKTSSSPLPPTPKEPHLTYSQESGELRGPDGKLLTVGHAGRGGGFNNPDAEGIKGVGPLPQGNWRMEEVKTSKWPDPSYKLTPDPETRDRVVALGRDPDSFYVHAQARDPKNLARDSSGCIALDKTSREALSAFNRRWIRVEK